MWENLLAINSVLLAIAFTYFVYAAGRGILFLEWKQAAFALLIVALFAVAEIVFGALSD